MTRETISGIERLAKEIPSIRFEGLGVCAAILRWAGATVLVFGLIGTAYLTVDLFTDDTIDQGFAYALASLLLVLTTSTVMLGLGYFFSMSIAVADDIHYALEVYLYDDDGDD